MRVPIIEIGSAIASFVLVESPLECRVEVVVGLLVADGEVVVAVVLLAGDDVEETENNEVEVDVEAEVEVAIDVDDSDVNRSDEIPEMSVLNMLPELESDEASAVCVGVIVTGIS
ncbi:hypothetical protein N7468_007700 [Penicillium chermesinum]|uniref:Uncharacterized protein n=1 Tax=Penicillium chermesinum TaxID=63820 RepID=A0A9W9TME5_9EURO|nr:uncharacterized protein N7468_007700 [Penicillium chermesinum]KAJ5226475.1 hypothetical protein N7468_007700 [Penicillium chermesinum]